MPNPALPLLVSVAIAVVAAPFPGVGAVGLRAASPAPTAAATAGAPAAGPGVVVGALERPVRLVALVRAGPVLGPPPALVAPQQGRTGLSSAALPAAPPVVSPPAAPLAVPPLAVPPLAVLPVLPGLVPPPAVARPEPPPPVIPLVTFPPPPMTAGLTVDPTGGPWLHDRATAALARISYPWRSLGYEIAFAPSRTGLRARTLLHERRIEVYARPSDPVDQTAFDLAHELAHAFDFSVATWGDRERWQRARGLDLGVAWFGCNACADLATPAGDFAESFALWQVPGGDFSSTLGPPPDEAQRALLAELTAP